MHLHSGVFYTQIYLYKEAFFWHSLSFFREMLLHTGAFRLGHFEAEKLLHGRSWKHSLGECSNHSGSRLPSIFSFTFAQKTCREMLLHTSVLRQTYIFTEMMLQRGTLRHSHIYTQLPLRCFSYTGIFFTHTRTRFNTDGFSRACLYTEVAVRRNTFTQRCFHTEIASHT